MQLPSIHVARNQCVSLLADLERIFTPDCKLTLIVRKPGNSEADLVLTADTLEEILAVLERTTSRDAWPDAPGE